ncbi:MAG TPA: tetraacyldisaccharide 4'-kinase [Candidatus Brocadiaceae bacterium]
MSPFNLRGYYLKVIQGKPADIKSRVVWNLLYPLSKMYGFVVKTRIFFYKYGLLKSVRLPIPVISVGNITTGGTGKTPVVEYIARFLHNKGKRVAILSRGYGAYRQEKGVAFPKDICNDEFLLFRENIPDIPDILNKDRVKGGQEAIQHFQAECLVLDDGFQHLRLVRDLDIVVIDALNPFGYEHIIPRGLLREPLAGLKRADLFVLTHRDQCSPGEIESIVGRLHKIAGYVPVVETIHKPSCLESVYERKRLDLNLLRGKKVFAFCALGNPLSFNKSIEGLGAEVICFRVFSDHHWYTSAELQTLNAEAQRLKPDVILVTQKDRVKIKDIRHTWDFPLWTLKIEICIVKGCEIFENKINSILQ